jgi:predicted permease
MPSLLFRDLRYSLRSIRGAPLASLTIVLSLAVGMGVTSTAFSILNAMVLGGLPGVADQDGLVTFAVSFEETERWVHRARFSWPDLEVLRNHPELFAEVAAAGPMHVAVDAGAGAELVEGEVVTANYFRTLGARPALGRFFEAEGDGADPGQGGEAGVVVLSHRYWLSRYASDPEILGRTVEVNGQALQVIGVAEEGFTGMTAEDVISGARVPLALWVPLSMANAIHPSWARPDPMALEARWLRPLARLREGVSLERMVLNLPALAGELERTHPEFRAGAEIVHGDLIFGPGAGSWRPALTILGFMVVPVIVLLVACANAANLLLARNAARRRDLAVRKALGASRWALLRQLLAETGILALASGSGGLLVALGVGRIAELFSVHLSMDVSLDWRVFTFVLVCALATGLFFGLVPALRVTREDVGSVLSGGSRGGSRTRGDSRLRDGLVVAQVALGLMLLVSSGLFVQSARHGLTVDTGMDEDRLLLLSLDLDLMDYEAAEGEAFYDRLVTALRGAPGVEDVALAARPPLEGSPSMRLAPAEGDADYGAVISVASVGDGLLETVGIRVLAGRTLTAVDVKEGSDVAVLNQAAAEHLWPGQVPLGRLLRTQERERVLEVVGIVADSRVSLFRQAEPIVYLPFAGTYAPQATLHIRTSGRPEASVEVVREVVRRLEPRLPVRGLEPALEVRRRLLEPWRLGYMALGVLGAVAVLLAGAGLYGVMAYAVSRRTREIGVRMALGAGSLAVVEMILRGALRLLAAGLALGFLLSAAVATLLRGALFGVSPVDPRVYGQVGALLLGVALLATFVPAVRAASVEPVRAIGSE